MGARLLHTTRCLEACPCPEPSAPPRSARDLLAVQASELWYVGEQRTAHHGTHTMQCAQEILLRAPDRAPLDRLVEIAIDLGDPSLEPPNVISQSLSDKCRRVLEPIALVRQHVEQ